MQILITHSGVAKTQVLHFSRWQLAAMGSMLVAALLLLSGAVYSLVFLKAAREQWPVLSTIVRPFVQGEFAQRDRFMRDNLDAMAKKVGEMQAKLVKLETLSERVAGQAGVKPSELRPSDKPAKGAQGGAQGGVQSGGQGGPFVPLTAPTLESLYAAVDKLDQAADLQADVMTLVESRMLEGRLAQLMLPSMSPVAVPVGSGFGFRSDPFTGRAALHSGLDFPAETGKPIMAAAGGVVISTEPNPSYGNQVEVDHGNGLVTRYAHASKVLVRAGDVVKRGQVIAQVGNSGRSTGPHLHFEVLVDGVPQDPARFLNASRK
jgi:murein DD-endopeptidase MepM/ murein hydrolase activator NlpD